MQPAHLKCFKQLSNLARYAKKSESSEAAFLQMNASPSYDFMDFISV